MSPKDYLNNPLFYLGLLVGVFCAVWRHGSSVPKGTSESSAPCAPCVLITLEKDLCLLLILATISLIW